MPNKRILLIAASVMAACCAASAALPASEPGIATAVELGVYGPEGQWLIEGRGVEPDIVIDNLPHDTFAGEDAQLKAALDLLKQEVSTDPRPVPPPPAYPNKAFPYKP